MTTEINQNQTENQTANSKTENQASNNKTHKNSNRELLNLIHKNATMGLISLKRLLCITSDAKFEEVLQNHLNGYREIFEKTKELLNKNGFEEISPGVCTKIGVTMSLEMQTLLNSSTSKLAELTLIGNCMGLAKAIKNKRIYADAEPDIMKLAEDYISMLERHIQELKIYL
ncbi:MAG TPA: hypothetical protein VIL23_03590 [Clostridia bacterium]